MSGKLALRPYQEECIQTINSLPDGSRSVVVLATGLGKTVVAANIDFEGRMLWISHRDELVRQPERYFRERGLSYGIEKAGEHSDGEDVVSASIQSLSRDNRLHSFDPEEFSVIICDEAHHAAAATYRKVLQYFRPKKLIGLTATPKRGDNVRLTDVFDDICFVRDLKWGIKNGYLSRIRCMRVYADFDLAKVKKTAGDFVISDMGQKMSKSNDDLVVARAYLDNCRPEGRQTIIYCPTVKVCEIVMHTIRSQLPEEEQGTIQMLSDKTPAGDRAAILEGFSRREVNCLVNCMILTEGTDLPETSAIINNRPSANSTLYTQLVGRGTRLAEGKDYCLVIDVVGENARSAGLCTAPELFGEDPNLLPEKIVKQLEGVDLLDACEELSEEHAKQAKSIRLVREMIDIFTQERLDIIRDNAGKGPGAVGDAYAETFTHPDDGIDFGDILAEKLPYKDRRYLICPTYNGHIWLSEPDLIGKTVMEFDVPMSETLSRRDVAFISEPIDIDAAIRFIHGFLTCCIPDYFSTCWSLPVRRNMESRPATDKQEWRIMRDFEKYGLRRGHVNRRQADDLIRLSVTLEELQEQAIEAEARVAEIEVESAITGKKKRGKRAEAWLRKKENERLKAEAEREERKRAYKPQAEFINGEIEKWARMMEKRKEEAEGLLGKPLSVNMRMDYSYETDESHPSVKQLRFLRSLAETCTRDGCVFDIEPDPEKLGLGMWHTGFLISYCLMFSKKEAAPNGFEYVLRLSDFVESIRKIPDERPDLIECRYEVRRKD